MKLPRRQFLHLAAGAAALPAVSRFAWAQAYPTRPVRIIVGFAAGGATDIIARLIGQWLSERLGQPFVIENRPGAGSNIGTEAVVRAPAGRLYAPHGRSTANAINATLYDKLNFNFIRDIAPVASIVRVPNVMVVNPSFPAKTVPEFIAYAKANPGKINMASAGSGTADPCRRRVVQDDDRRRHGPRAVSRRGTCADRSARRAGAGRCSTPCRRPSSYIRAGKLRALAVTDARRVRRHCRTSRPWANSCRATRRAVGSASARPGTRQPRSSTSSTRRSMPPSPIPSMKARLADLGGTVLRRLARRLRKAHRRRNREMGQSDPVRGHQAGMIGSPPTFHNFRSANGWCPSVWTT